MVEICPIFDEWIDGQIEILIWCVDHVATIDLILDDNKNNLKSVKF